MDSNYILFLVSGVATLILLSIVFDYLRRDSGLKKGGVLLLLVAVILFMMPNASNIIFKFAGNELAFKSNQEEEQLFFSELTEMSKYADKQNKVLAEKLDGIAHSLTIHGEMLRVIHQDNNDSDELANLKAEQEKISEAIAAEFSSYLIKFESITFDKVCENLNSVGEFYYAFLINGTRVVNRPLEERVQKMSGDMEPFSNNMIEIKSVQNNDTFRLAGFINEYDGYTIFGRRLKITSVGEVEKEFPLSAGSLTIPIGNVENKVCRATLQLSIAEL